MILAALAFLSLAITLWQWGVARRFPLHARVGAADFSPPVTILKPLTGADTETRSCLESWFTQDYLQPVQILFGVASDEDPVCPVIRELIAAYPRSGAQLILCSESLGANAKVSTLAQLHRLTRHDVIVISDADVRVPPDFLTNMVSPLRDRATTLITCFYCLPNPATLAMQWEAIAVNADFWSQVLQAQSLKPLDFALGAAIATRRRQLDAVGGFEALADFLADDYQLGNRIARQGGAIVISPVVVECREAPKNWKQVWRHQLRWGRTIRACRPLSYFLSILGNATLWPLLWMFAELPSVTMTPRTFPGGSLLQTSWPPGVTSFVAFLAVRVLIAVNLQSRLTRSPVHHGSIWLVPIKDLLGAAIWALSLLGNRVEWRGQCYRVLPGGKLAPVSSGEKAE